MMNNFGVPMTDADINMTSNPAKVMLEQQLTTSGIENQWVGAVVGGAISAGGALIGGSRSARAAADQAEKQNEATIRRFEYDTAKYDMDKQQIRSNRNFAVQEILAKQRNENRVADFRDASAARQYDYNLAIRNQQQASNDAQYERSEDIYGTQMDLNARSAQTAYENEARSLEEIHTERAFNLQTAQLDALVQEGKLRARGVTGRTAMKGYQATAADYGRQVAQLDESFASAGRNTRAVMQEIATDKASADLAAYAQRMLDPGDLPMPLQPMDTPRAEFILPRALGEFDFGPEPVLGAMASPSAAANRVWGSTISGIAGSIGSITQSYLQNQ